MPSAEFYGTPPLDAPPLTVQWAAVPCTHEPGETCYCLALGMETPFHLGGEAGTVQVGSVLILTAETAAQLIATIRNACEDVFGDSLREPSPCQVVEPAWALAVAGLDGEIHPSSVTALIYPSREYFDTSAKRDRARNGNDVHGPYDTSRGLLGIVDLRPQLRRQGVRVMLPGGELESAPHVGDGGVAELGHGRVHADGRDR